jgi:predicted kinase
MSKIATNKPVIFMLYGYPGAGKTYFSKQLTNILQTAHVHGDRIRYELFENPNYDKTENEIVNHIMHYMSDEFLSAGISVLYDNNVYKKSERMAVKELARKNNCKTVLIWLQIDEDSAFSRTTSRDRRKSEDKYAMPLDQIKFDEFISTMQNPTTDEDYLVLSGKHSFPMQQSNLFKRLFDMNMITAESVSSKVVKPGMINLVPAAGRVDMNRRNVFIR